MMTWCSYCQKYLGEKEPLTDFSISHGICQNCLGSEAFSTPKLDWAKDVREFFLIVSDKAIQGRPLSFRSVTSLQRSLGISDNDLLMGIIQPILYEIGERFARGRVRVAVEHSFTMFCEDLLHQLRGERSHDILYEQPDGCQNLLVCIDHNWHSLGVQFASFFLRDLGTESVSVYPGLPNEEIIELIRFYQPRRLGISIAMPEQLACLNKLAVHLKRLPAEFRPVKIVAGGFVFRSGHARIDPLFTVAPFDAESLSDLFSDKKSSGASQFRRRSRADHPRSSVSSRSESPPSANSV